jgi:hypothetical protein
MASNISGKSMAEKTPIQVHALAVIAAALS